MAQRCTDYLENRGVRISVSDVASRWKNSYIESFYGRFKHELDDLNRFDTVGEMIAAIYQHIHHRIHTVIKIPLTVCTAHTFLDTCLHKMGT